LNDKEHIVAAGLFLLTALALPILFRPAAGSPESRKEDIPFLVESALLELRLDASVELIDDAAEASSQPRFRLFDSGYWLTSTEPMKKEERETLLSQIAVACVALGRDEEAERLADAARLAEGNGQPLSFVLKGLPLPSGEELARGLEATHLPDWVEPLLAVRYPEAGGPRRPVDRQAIYAQLASHATATGLLLALMAVLFVTGIVVLAGARRILAVAQDHPDEFAGLVRFGAPPLMTYLMFASWFLLATMAGMAAVFLLGKGFSQAGVILVGYLATALVGWVLVRRRGEPRGKSLGETVDLDSRTLSWRALRLGVLGYVAAIPLVFMLSFVSMTLLGGGEEGLNPAIPALVAARGGSDRWILVGNVVILAPLFEEFFFRGFLFQQLKRFLGTANGIALSAAMFAAVHLSIESFLPLFGLGVILASVYHVTRSLWASIVTHALWNLGTVAGIFVLFD
jgi:membrane protease YdiL (CAAX protease family)